MQPQVPAPQNIIRGAYDLVVIVVAACVVVKLSKRPNLVAIPTVGCSDLAGIPIYHNAGTFDPFRFANLNMGDKDGGDAKHSFVSTNPDYLEFGLGRHAWSGDLVCTNHDLQHVLLSLIHALLSMRGI
ncbi:hypothetical protein BDN67DRAFT_1008365 [Paxillus ammoniavirescens]|nr:hypothetical protein BDN67DRAFT_1008365 [Paxillus ammoniavirescens]